MTVHGAKGLEATVVFLADPRGERTLRRVTWIDRSGAAAGGTLARVADKRVLGEIEIALPPAGKRWPPAKRSSKRRRGIRLLYVGATRAAEMLVVSVKRNAARKAGGPWAALDPFLTADLALPAPAPGSAAAPPRSRAGDLRAGTGPRRASPRGRRSRPDLSRRARHGHRARRREAGLGEHRPRHVVGARSPRRRSRRRCATRRSICRLSPRTSSPKRSARPGTSKRSCAWSKRVRASPLWARARAAKRRLVEVPFALRVRARRGRSGGRPRADPPPGRDRPASSKRRTAGCWWTTSRTPSERTAILSSASTLPRWLSTPATGRSSPAGRRGRGYSSWPRERRCGCPTAVAVSENTR